MQDNELLIEVWDSIKIYISSKDRVSAATNLIRIFDENGMSDGLEHETDLDTPLKAAVVHHFGIEHDSDEEIEEF